MEFRRTGMVLLTALITLFLVLTGAARPWQGDCLHGMGPGRMAAGSQPLERKRLLIVAPKQFRAELAAYVRHKRQQLPTELVAPERVLKTAHGVILAASPADKRCWMVSSTPRRRSHRW